MKWTPKAQETFELLLRDVAPEYKEPQRRHAMEAIENYCNEARFREVGSDQVVIGYIRATPAHQRQGLKQVMRLKGIIVEKYEGHFMMP